MLFSVLGKNIFVEDGVSGITVNIIQLFIYLFFSFNYLNWKQISIVSASKYNIEIKLFWLNKE